MTAGYRSKSIKEDGGAGPRVHNLPVDVFSIWATSGPAERSDLSPTRGARGSAAHFSANHRRLVTPLYAEAPRRMVSVLPNTAKA